MKCADDQAGDQNDSDSWPGKVVGDTLPKGDVRRAAQQANRGLRSNMSALSPRDTARLRSAIASRLTTAMTESFARATDTNATWRSG